MKKKCKNTVEQKRKELSVLQKKSEGALNLVNSTINNLSTVNEQIDVKVSEIEELEHELASTKNELITQKDKNKKIVDKFRQLVEG